MRRPTRSLVSSLTSLIFYSIVMVFALQRPFTGDFSIEPYAFQQLIDSFNHTNGPVAPR